MFYPWSNHDISIPVESLLKTSPTSVCKLFLMAWQMSGYMQLKFLCLKTVHFSFQTIFSWHDRWLTTCNSNSCNHEAFSSRATWRHNRFNHCAAFIRTTYQYLLHSKEIEESPPAGNGWFSTTPDSSNLPREEDEKNENTKERHQVVRKPSYFQNTDLVLKQPTTTKNIFRSHARQLIVHILKNVCLVHRQRHLSPPLLKLHYKRELHKQNTNDDQTLRQFLPSQSRAEGRSDKREREKRERTRTRGRSCSRVCKP